MNGSPPGVILVAHGSARSGESAEPVLALAEALSARGFREVRTAFWKEEPFLHQALDTTRSSTVAVLPVFLAEGYFSRTVVPRELGLRYGVNLVGGHHVHLLPPLATAATLAEIVVERAREATPPGVTPSDAALVVLGHGTPRDPGSASAVLRVCAELEVAGGFARVAPAFIDQDPLLEGVLARLSEPVVLVAPFLVAAGYHGGTTVPQELGRSDDTAMSAGRRRVVYAEPVGTHRRMIDLAEKVLSGTGAASAAPGATSPAPLAGLERALAELLERSSKAALLQVEARVHGDDHFELRHTDDSAVDPAELEELATLHSLARLACKRTDGAHRPLRTAADLPRGWRLSVSGLRGLVEALVAVYGPALTHWYLAETGALRAGSFRETAQRQTGIYARLGSVGPELVTTAIGRCCEGLPCLRVRRWSAEGHSPALSLANPDTAGTRLVVPCPAPCPILLSTALELTGGAEENGEDAG